jgi:hypothetical protein
LKNLTVPVIAIEQLLPRSSSPQPPRCGGSADIRTSKEFEPQMSQLLRRPPKEA